MKKLLNKEIIRKMKTTLINNNYSENYFYDVVIDIVDRNRDSGNEGMSREEFKKELIESLMAPVEDIVWWLYDREKK